MKSGGNCFGKPLSADKKIYPPLIFLSAKNNKISAKLKKGALLPFLALKLDKIGHDSRDYSAHRPHLIDILNFINLDINRAFFPSSVQPFIFVSTH
ncbi:hypothetical protein [Cytobacillus gottheilii]|uniref:hypothetical protein n=1 Tax=Cytobacillus gottheilii TaxID=859144 RepID=UPI001594036B|nr:hypothetical protein [Cytobacillus gottheilii]